MLGRGPEDYSRGREIRIFLTFKQMRYSMQIEMGLTDLFSLEPVDSRFRNFSKKAPSFIE